jgi:hypothetical protein
MAPPVEPVPSPALPPASAAGQRLARFGYIRTVLGLASIGNDDVQSFLAGGAGQTLSGYSLNLGGSLAVAGGLNFASGWNFEAGFEVGPYRQSTADGGSADESLWLLEYSLQAGGGYRWALGGGTVLGLELALGPALLTGQFNDTQHTTFSSGPTTQQASYSLESLSPFASLGFRLEDYGHGPWAWGAALGYRYADFKDLIAYGQAPGVAITNPLQYSDGVPATFNDSGFFLELSLLWSARQPLLTEVRP